MVSNCWDWKRVDWDDSGWKPRWKIRYWFEPEWTWCAENHETKAGLFEVDSRLTSARSRAFLTISARNLSSSSKSFFLYCSYLRPTTNRFLRRLSSWFPKPQSIKEWRRSARYSSTDWFSCWSINWNRTRDASFETFLPCAVSRSVIRVSKLTADSSSGNRRFASMRYTISQMKVR